MDQVFVVEDSVKKLVVVTSSRYDQRAVVSIKFAHFPYFSLLGIRATEEDEVSSASHHHHVERQDFQVEQRRDRPSSGIWHVRQRGRKGRDIQSCDTRAQDRLPTPGLRMVLPE